MASTTITVPQYVQLWTVNTSTQGFLPASAPYGTTTITAGPNFALYIPLDPASMPTTVHGDQLLNVLGSQEVATAVPPTPLAFVIPAGSSFPARTFPNLSASNISNIALSASETLYVAFTKRLPETVDAQTLRSDLQFAAFNPAPVTTIPTQTSDTASSTRSLSTNGTSSSSTTSPAANNGIGAGALAGATIGAFFGGLLLCALGIWCIFRRRRSSYRRTTSEEPSGSGMPLRDVSRDAKRQSFVSSADVTGWQKHLPQEKDDSALSRTFRSLFYHIQMHTEEYYASRAGKPNAQALQALELIAADDLPRTLGTTSSTSPVVEGILVRFIVHRISLRSQPSESFLPSEYTTIPAKNRWHMESEGTRDALPAESKRGKTPYCAVLKSSELTAPSGFVQAFSEWRVLTGYLHSQVKADPDFKKELEHRIDLAIHQVSTALAPWETAGKSKSRRTQSLKEILLEASDAGILLFTQPSTFMFGWNSMHAEQTQAVVLAPALVRRLDESAEAMSSPQILLEAKLLELENV